MMPSHARILISAGVMVAGLMLACDHADQGNAPDIEVSERGHDFGVVPLGQRVEHTFTIRNAGSAALVLRKEAVIQTLEGC